MPLRYVTLLEVIEAGRRHRLLHDAAQLKTRAAHAAQADACPTREEIENAAQAFPVADACLTREEMENAVSARPVT